MLRRKISLKQIVGLCLCVLFGIYASVIIGGSFSVESQTLSNPNFQQPYGRNLTLRGVQVAPEGILLLVNGNPQVVMQRIVAPDRLVVDLLGTTVLPQLHKATVPINRYGVRQIRIAQNQKNPAIARIVLDFEPNLETNLEWQTTFNSGRGVILTNQAPQTNLPANTPDTTSNSEAVIIQKVILTDSGQLLIQTNQPFTYLGTEDLPSGTFNISINAARISQNLQRPNLDANSPLEWIRLTQVGNSVLIGLKPGDGWRIKEITRSDPQQIYLQIVRADNTENPIPRIPPPVIPSSISNRGRGVIVIDPGHGGKDVGAIGNGIYEKNIVLAISLQLGQTLQQMGYAVVYTRTDDTEVELQPRVNVASQVKADAFISIHANSLATRASQVSGIETYYAPGSASGGQLATAVHNQIIIGTGAIDRGVRTARFHVVVKTTMPAILVETGFVTNPRESADLNSKPYQERMANAIARGVDRFVRSFYGR
jgi:N-acetylmuramoyl-L-alanine amidase